MAPPPASHDTRQVLLATAIRIMAHKGFAAVGLNEVLQEAGVPKGSFYHYFNSKESFGEAVMRTYFLEYLTNMDRILDRSAPAAERVLAYFDDFRATQSADGFRAGCLVVKLGAEVSDVSEAMRSELDRGVHQVLARLESVVGDGTRDGSIVSDDARQLAQTLWHLWIGASVTAKIGHDPRTFEATMQTTRHLLGTSGSRP